MQAVILAAGTGSRMNSLTADRPKAMLEVLGLPLIHHAIRSLLTFGITDISLVVGYRHQILIQYVLEAFPGHRIGFIYNPCFGSLNNIYSFHLTEPCFSGRNLLVMNSDVFCEPELIRDLIYGPPNSMLVDTEKSYSSEATKVRLNRQGFIYRVSKQISAGQSRGEYIGILKLSGRGSRMLYREVREMLYRGETALWFVYALNPLLPRLDMKPVYVKGRVWEEIDDREDYLNAQKLAEELSKTRIY